MSTLPLALAEKILLLMAGESIPASKMKYTIVEELMAEGILYKPGKLKSTIQLINQPQLLLYLQNHYAIADLNEYVAILKKEEYNRTDLITISTDSKLRNVRTFKGFLVNSYAPVSTTLNGEPFEIHPQEGSFQFVYDFDNFVPAADIMIVGVENAENFRHIAKQQYLFKDLQPLFVSRYPQNQSKDMIKWLKSIPNNYVHYGDFDMAGIGIYIHEYLQKLSNKTRFFIPDNIDFLLKTFGNKARYDEQKINFDISTIEDKELLQLIQLIHSYRKGLDQEVLISLNSNTQDLNKKNYI